MRRESEFEEFDVDFVRIEAEVGSVAWVTLSSHPKVNVTHRHPETS